MKMTKEQIISLLPKRPLDANKGTFGKVLVIAGSENFPGAAYLACAGAYRIGVGLVTLITNNQTKIIISRKLPELTFLSYHQGLKKVKDYDVVLLGPGLGQNAEIVGFIEKLTKEKLPKAVIDADGLNILSRMHDWWKKLNSKVILTPHPGEMSKLTGLSIREVESNRAGITQRFAKKWNQVVILKGANTIIGSPKGNIFISPFANPALATAGTGDVLAGIISGMLAQGLKPFDAACVGVYIHGLAGEMLKEKIGNTGALASDLLPFLPQTIKQLI